MLGGWKVKHVLAVGLGEVGKPLFEIVWRAFGHRDYYASEKEKQEAIYEELQRKKKIVPPSPLGGVGKCVFFWRNLNLF